LRRLAKGRLSELFGKETVPIDEFLRAAGLFRASQETWDSGVDSNLAEVLEAYADGVNDFVKGVSLAESE